MTRKKAAAGLIALAALVSGGASSEAQPRRPRAEASPPSAESAQAAGTGTGAPTNPLFRAMSRGGEGEEKIGERCQRAARAVLRKSKLARQKVADAGASPAAISAELEADIEWFKTMHLECLEVKSGLTAGLADVGSDVLRSVAQVVLKRAERAAWGMLRDALREAAHCDDPSARAPNGLSFPTMCRVLSTIEMRDLVSSPATLINATTSDFLASMARTAGQRASTPLILQRALIEAAARWDQAEEQGLSSGLRHVLSMAVRESSSKAGCPELASTPEKALWAIGMCLIEVQNPQNYDSCDVNGWAEICAPPSEGSGSSELAAKILQIWSLGGRALAAKQAQTADLVKMTFTLADLAVAGDKQPSAGGALGYAREARSAAAREEIDALKTFFLGIAEKDWVQATTGAVRTARIMSAAGALGALGASEVEGSSGSSGASSSEDDRRIERLFTLLAAIGSYGETYSKGSGDSAAVSAARERIIQDLVDRMVNRTDRQSGVVISLGGNFGVIGGVRTDYKSGFGMSFPLQLGLGVGLQTYGRGSYGFHAQATALDLGQYVALGSKGIDVESASVESALAIGLSLGAWVGMRETPIYIGAFSGVSPFVRVNKAATYQVGLVTGVYVPLIDFN